MQVGLKKYFYFNYLFIFFNCSIDICTISNVYFGTEIKFTQPTRPQVLLEVR